MNRESKREKEKALCLAFSPFLIYFMSAWYSCMDLTVVLESALL